jgi:pre-mRNA 3'-end-processing factor FIP1
MPEEQITALPPEIRSMVMASATTFMSAGGANPGIMPTNVGMPMMGEIAMNMPQMSMMNGMNGDMSGMQMGAQMPDNGSGGTGIPVQLQQDPGGGDGFGGPSAAMMGMMGGDYGMQVTQLFYFTVCPNLNPMSRIQL